MRKTIITQYVWKYEKSEGKLKFHNNYATLNVASDMFKYCLFCNACRFRGERVTRAGK